MKYWSWEAGGLALAGIMLLHWLLTRRMMAVSGRYTALVNRLRLGAPAQEPELDTAALIAAIRAATAEEFGEQAVEAAPAQAVAPAPDRAEVQSLSHHLVFLACLVLGGFISALTSGRFHLTPGIASSGFARLTHGSFAAGCLVLLFGGALVGFGTRMAGGCTSGHGMCGVSRFQSGSLLATVAFFGTGVVTAFALAWLP